jgi:hypothetical protein
LIQLVAKAARVRLEAWVETEEREGRDRTAHAKRFAEWLVSVVIAARAGRVVRVGPAETLARLNMSGV